MEKTTTPPKERVFFASFAFIYKYSLALGTLVLVLLYVLGNPGSLSGLLRHLAIMALPIMLAYALTSVFLRWFCRVRMTPEGIRGGTFWGTPVVMSWGEMESVAPRSLLGLPYLRVKSFRESCPTMWIPRFLAEPAAFREAVAVQVSSSHPLHRSLENGGTAERREDARLRSN